MKLNAQIERKCQKARDRVGRRAERAWTLAICAHVRMCVCEVESKLKPWILPRREPWCWKNIGSHCSIMANKGHWGENTTTSMRGNYWLQSIGRNMSMTRTFEAEVARTGQPVDLRTTEVMHNYFCKYVHQRDLLVTSQHTGKHPPIHKCPHTHSYVGVCVMHPTEQQFSSLSTSFPLFLFLVGGG